MTLPDFIVLFRETGSFLLRSLQFHIVWCYAVLKHQTPYQAVSHQCLVLGKSHFFNHALWLHCR